MASRNPAGCFAIHYVAVVWSNFTPTTAVFILLPALRTMAFEQGGFFKDMYELPELLLCQLVVSDTEPLTIQYCLPFLVAPLEIHHFLNIRFQHLRNRLIRRCFAVFFMSGTNITNQSD